MRKTYQALQAPVDWTYEEKRSRFIAYLNPIESRACAMAQLDHLKQQYPDARHHCWAYILGDTRQPKNAAFADDGEPSGTAGKPILNVLTHRQAGDTMAIVVRYFGGIKLGAGGLVRAYGAAVSQALDSATWKTIVPTQTLSIYANYAYEERLRSYLTSIGAQNITSAYTELVSLTCDIPEDKLLEIEQSVTNITSGSGIVLDK